MKAMLLAAGIGSRLGELTKNTPKCLVQVNGKAIVEYVIENLKKTHVDDLVINLYHFPELIKKFLQDKKYFGLRISYSEEQDLLGTGGGLNKAKRHFVNETAFLMHNADVYSEIELNKVVSQHMQTGCIATLVVLNNPTSRPLFFDEHAKLVGWSAPGKNEMIGATEQSRAFNFSGIQVCSPKIFDFMPKDKKGFSIIDTYMNAAKAGEKILAYIASDSYWIDVGTPERLQQLKEHLVHIKL